MNYSDLLKAVLLVVVRFAVVWFFALIKVPLDPALLDTIVAAIVVWLLSLFVHQVAAVYFPKHLR